VCTLVVCTPRAGCTHELGDWFQSSKAVPRFTGSSFYERKATSPGAARHTEPFELFLDSAPDSQIDRLPLTMDEATRATADFTGLDDWTAVQPTRLVQHADQEPAPDAGTPSHSSPARPPDPATGAPDDERTGGEAAPRDGAPSRREPLGKAPEDNSLLFLRQATVLLAPGQCQLDYGFVYTWQELIFPVELSGGDLANDRLRTRSLVVPNALRYGLTKRVQLYANIPWGYGNVELGNPEREINEDFFNLGDVGAGINYLLREGDGPGCSDVIATVGFNAPTGEEPFAISSITTTGATLGTGFWTFSTDLLCVKSIDPVVLFTGVGYRHFFSRQFFGGELAPGEEFNYVFGAGFAINDTVTLSTTFRGAYLSETEFDDRGLPGSEIEPFTLRFAVTSTCGDCRIIEPFVTAGLNDDAPEAQFGVVFTRTY
jgi:hypothetical protein